MAEVQEEILWACEAAHLPVVWATQVLESLAKKGLPSRAEITDAASADYRALRDAVVDLSLLAGRVARVEITATGCAEARLLQRRRQARTNARLEGNDLAVQCRADPAALELLAASSTRCSGARLLPLTSTSITSRSRLR